MGAVRDADRVDPHHAMADEEQLIGPEHGLGAPEKLPAGSRIEDGRPEVFGGSMLDDDLLDGHGRPR